jgi:hypothetical protein
VQLDVLNNPTNEKALDVQPVGVSKPKEPFNVDKEKSHDALLEENKRRNFVSFL